MSFFSTLRRFSQFPQRFHTLHSSTSQSPSSSNPHHNPKWASSVFVVGSAIALLYCFATPNSHFNSSNDPHNSSRSLFRKLSLPENTHNFIFGGISLNTFYFVADEYRSKVFFNYEKRIRLHSPPEKVFEYFASCRTPEGKLFMKPADLMRAIVPVFPPSESNLVRDGYLKGERSPGQICCPPSEFFMLFDVNGDQLISFKEYTFFVTLLSIPESSFSAAFKMFDKDNDGEIDAEEFKKVMASMRCHTRQGVHHMDGQRTGLKANGSVENGGLVEYFFGKDGKGRLRHDKFVQFIRDLHDEILRLEFTHYDYKSQKTISAKDFAHSIVASADASHLSRLLERVDELNNDPRFRDVCGLSLSDNVVEIVFHLFDTSGDGNLSSDEFVKVLHRRERDIAQPVGTGILGFLSCCLNCTDTFPYSRLFS
ncbi:EF-Hand 1, calcium-binding site [Sesbania bispinosa]|nr:EF-Hand 1, calcium-binding site [Sesbania bispinosa]